MPTAHLVPLLIRHSGHVALTLRADAAPRGLKVRVCRHRLHRWCSRTRLPAPTGAHERQRLAKSGPAVAILETVLRRGATTDRPAVRAAVHASALADRPKTARIAEMLAHRLRRHVEIRHQLVDGGAVVRLTRALEVPPLAHPDRGDDIGPADLAQGSPPGRDAHELDAGQGTVLDSTRRSPHASTTLSVTSSPALNSTIFLPNRHTSTPATT
jgi:hypothetical protein